MREGRLFECVREAAPAPAPPLLFRAERIGLEFNAAMRETVPPEDVFGAGRAAVDLVGVAAMRETVPPEEGFEAGRAAGFGAGLGATRETVPPEEGFEAGRAAGFGAGLGATRETVPPEEGFGAGRAAGFGAGLGATREIWGAELLDGAGPGRGAERWLTLGAFRTVGAFDGAGLEGAARETDGRETGALGALRGADRPALEGRA